MQRRWLMARAAPGPLLDFLETPFPSLRGDYNTTQMVALDLETSGLNPRSDAIVSIGWVEFDVRGIDLASSRHLLVHSAASLTEESVVIHGITDDVTAGGLPLARALPPLLHAVAGKVLVAHHAELDVGFIAEACRRLWGMPWVVPVIDTQRLAKKRLDRRGAIYSARDLRLNALRRRYNLPRYKGHNALSDAVSAAELFLAHMAHVNPRQKKIPLRNLLMG